MKGGSKDGSLPSVESRMRASADCRGCANLRQSLLSPLGSCYHLSISSFKEAGVMTWAHSGSRARGRGPHFDVSREVREGAGGEGQEELARKLPLPSQASVHKDTSSSSPPFISSFLGRSLCPSRWASLGSLSLTSILCPDCGPITCSHILFGKERGTRWVGVAGDEE